MTDAVQFARQMTGPQLWASLAWHAFARFRNRLPRLVWYNDEVDVQITFKEARLPEISATTPFNEAMSHLDRGHMAKVERMLNEIGITFDKGAGEGGRDWEFDWSLRGPVSVRFRGRAKHPERRV